MNAMPPHTAARTLHRHLPIWLLLVTLVVTALLYWPGLYGPLLFDDYWNLTPVVQWEAGMARWQAALLPNADSLVFSRPLSMASFMASVWLGGLETTFPLKVGNLLTHLACGTAGWWLLRGFLQRDAQLSSRARWIALALIAVWLLHPMQVSTVLYVVQRMAQLSTLLTLIALCVFLAGRQKLSAAQSRQGAVLLFVVFPLCTALGVLAKQNAAIAPFLCVVIELAYFRDQSSLRRPLSLFYGAFVALPLLAASALMIATPQMLLAGYHDYEFTLGERLLTQPRVLFDYIGMWFVPRSSAMGLYTDDVVVSKALTTPWTTLPAIAGLVATSIFAVSARSRAPSVFAGWFFFLVAHAVESTFLPLEMYYEHRNYLPSLGLLLMAAGIVEWIFRTRPLAADKRAFSLMLGCIVLLTLSASTLGRVLVWQNEQSMVDQGLMHHPDSLRLRIDGVALALRGADRDAADPDGLASARAA